MSDDRADRIQRMREGRRGADEPDEADDHDEADAVDTVDDGDADVDAAAAPATDTDADVDAAATDTDPDAADLDAEITEAVEGMDVSETGDLPDLDVADDDGDAPDDEAAESSTTDDETISVLEFVLGDEQYCLDITYIEQIVERGTVTRIPNAPPFVEGVIDLRGDITTVIDPKQTLATGSDDDGDLIVVFDPDGMDDEWSVGWAVDGVRRVSTVSLSEVKESPVDEPWINGVVKRDEDGEFVIWTEPGELMRDDAEAGR